MRFILKLAAAFGLRLAAHRCALAAAQVDIDLSSQTMHVRSGSGESYVWRISSGRSGHATPHGVFRPRALYRMVHSAKYNNAPMPHSIFFYGQYAIHGTDAVGHLGRRASHGCIRLSRRNAAVLFAMVQAQGGVIRVVGSAARSPVARGHIHGSDTSLGYAPVQRERSFSEWMGDPLAH
jgi:hypothetical protein